ncbi:MAG: response regulator [Streptosporangiaceae bacterium]
MTIQVILADDQPLVRAGLRRLIERTPDIDVAGEAGTGAEAVRLARDTGADVVVMDIRMPGMDGIEATRLITAAGTRARVLVLTTFDEDDYVYGALRAGASGTAKTHVARLLAKLGARDRVQLVITAYEAGLVSASR